MLLCFHGFLSSTDRTTEPSPFRVIVNRRFLDQSHLNGSSLVVVTSAGLAFYGLALTIYRIWFHPLAGFPGPKLAAATGWYQTYYEVMTYGKLSFKLAELHTRYGMAFPTCMLGC